MSSFQQYNGPEDSNLTEEIKFKIPNNSIDDIIEVEETSLGEKPGPSGKAKRSTINVQCALHIQLCSSLLCCGSGINICSAERKLNWRVMIEWYSFSGTKRKIEIESTRARGLGRTQGSF